MTYAQIARSLKVNYMLVSTIIERYHRNGNWYDPQSYTRNKKKNIIPPHVIEWLVKWETLQQMRYRTVKERIKIIEERYHLRGIRKWDLIGIYKENGIGYKLPGKENRLTDAREKALVFERILFARKLRKLIN